MVQWGAYNSQMLLLVLLQTFFISTLPPAELQNKQAVLDLFEVSKRLEKLLELLEHEVDILGSMVRLFDERAGALGLGRTPVRGRSAYDVVKVASLIQAEAGVESDRALIAGVIQNPSARSPFDNPKNSIERRNVVIRAKQYKPEELQELRKKSLGLSLRDLDAITEAVPGVITDSWMAVAGPPGMPMAIARRLFQWLLLPNAVLLVLFSLLGKPTGKPVAPYAASIACLFSE